MWVLFDLVGKFKTYTQDARYTTADWTVVSDSIFNPYTQVIEKNIVTGEITVSPSPPPQRPSPPQTNFFTYLPSPTTITTSTPSESVPVGIPVVIEKDGLYNIDGLIGITGPYGEIMDFTIQNTPAGTTTPVPYQNSKRTFLNYAGGTSNSTLSILKKNDVIGLTLTPLTGGTKNINMASLKILEVR